jgi:hypothetical protein
VLAVSVGEYGPYRSPRLFSGLSHDPKQDANCGEHWSGILHVRRLLL